MQQDKKHVSYEVTDKIAKILLDQFPEVKQQVCCLINELAQVPEVRLGLYGKDLINGLVKNSRHQRRNVRKSSVEAIGALVMAEGA